MIITKQAYVDEMPIYEFETAALPAALKGIGGEAKNTLAIGRKTYVKNWTPTGAERLALAKGKRITVRQLRALQAAEAPGETAARREV